ncbi:MAG: hypothetical protein OXB91_01425 [Bryobacterales bacterium]|nr:hypothetical protein [Bryobacterales bacterium]
MLALLRPAAQEDDQGIAVLTEIDPLAGAEVDAAFEYTGTDTHDAGEVSLLHADQRGRRLGCCVRVEPTKPFGVRATASGVDLLPDFNHWP